MSQWLCFTTINNNSVQRWPGLACDRIRPDWKHQENFEEWQCMFAIENDHFNWVSAMVWLGKEAKTVSVEDDLKTGLKWVAQAMQWVWAEYNAADSRKTISHFGGTLLDWAITEIMARAGKPPKKNGYRVGYNADYQAFLQAWQVQLKKLGVPYDAIVQHFTRAEFQGSVLEAAVGLA